MRRGRKEEQKRGKNSKNDQNNHKEGKEQELMMRTIFGSETGKRDRGGRQRSKERQESKRALVAEKHAMT